MKISKIPYTRNMTIDLSEQYKFIHIKANKIFISSDFNKSILAKMLFSRIDLKKMKADFKERMAMIPCIVKAEFIQMDLDKFENTLSWLKPEVKYYYLFREYIDWLKKGASDHEVPHFTNHPDLNQAETIGLYIMQMSAGIIDPMSDSELARYLKEKVTYGNNVQFASHQATKSSITKLRGQYRDRDAIEKKLKDLILKSSIDSKGAMKKLGN